MILRLSWPCPPTLTEFQVAIHGHRGSTSPGATGLTHNMAKGWPPEVTEFAHRCLLQLWDQKDTPTWMQWGWLCPKPKDPEAEITLDGLRPLILLEVIRKLWVGIVVNRITRAWERHGVLAPGQHGFRPGRGTDSALLQFLNATSPSMRWKHKPRCTPPAGISAGRSTRSRGRLWR